MKKTLIWLTVLCMLLSFAAVAESPGDVIDPFADGDSGLVAVVGDEEPGEADADYDYDPGIYPDGEELQIYETGQVKDVGNVTVLEEKYDIVEARNADEVDNTVRYGAKPGQQLICFRVSRRTFKDILFEDAIDASVQIGSEKYACRSMIESKKINSVDGGDVDCRDAMAEGDFYYLVKTEDNDRSWKEGYYRYVLFDVFTMVPQEVFDKGEPIFLLIKLGDKQFWYEATMAH